MNLFALVLKQLRQRSLSTVLTILSVALGVGLATAILIFQDQGNKLFGQSEFGFDIILGPKGSELELVLNNVYQASPATSTIPYSTYTDLTHRLNRHTGWAMPIAMGDNYQGYRLIATQPKVIETKALADVRAKVRDEVQRVRDILNPLREPKKTPTLPLPAATPDLAKLFSLQQAFRNLAPTADAYDPEARLALERTASGVSALIETLQTSSDRTAILVAVDAVLDDAGQSVSLLGGPIQPRPDRPFDLASGRSFEHDKFECVIGSEVAQKLKLKIGDQIQAEHGMVEARTPDQHDEKWAVVGILKPTFTAFDRLIFIPLTSFYAIPVHENALGAMAAKSDEYRRARGDPQDAGPQTPATTQAATDHHDEPSGDPHEDDGDGDHHEHHYNLQNGHIVLDMPKEKWKLSSVLVGSREATLPLIWDYRQTPDAMAVNPATEMRRFSETFLRGSSLVLLLLAILVTVVAAVSILVSIYNSIAARRREIAILRALGATRNRILSIICLEAGAIGLIGTVCGFVLGHALAAIGSAALNRLMGEGINWLHVSLPEMVYLVGAVLLSVLSGLVPALKAYSTPVATNLVGE